MELPSGRWRAWCVYAGFLAAGVAAIWVLSVTGLLATSSAQSQAPAVTLELPDGELINLNAPGRVVVLNFYASWCPPCRDEAPALRTVAGRLEDRSDVTMLGVIFQDDANDAAQYLNDYSLPYSAVSDEGGRLAKAFRVGGIPRTIVIDRAGAIVLSHFGAIRADQLLGAIEEATGR